jgi:hypothetical protein
VYETAIALNDTIRIPRRVLRKDFLGLGSAGVFF